MGRRRRGSPSIRIVCGHCWRKIDDLQLVNLWSSGPEGLDVAGRRGAQIRARYGQTFQCPSGHSHPFRQASLRGAYDRAVTADRSAIVVPTDLP
jgi:hypothetical protein